jgi:hypothetical protein
MTKVIEEVFWNASCSCGWETKVANDADTVANKVKTHLQQIHRNIPATIAITSYVEVRPSGVLPALGKLPTAPLGVTVSPVTGT